MAQSGSIESFKQENQSMKVWFAIVWGPDTQLIGPFGDDKHAAIQAVRHEITAERAEQGAVVEWEIEDVTDRALKGLI